MIVATDRAGLLRARAELVGSVGLVITMGALHAGHAALVRAARERTDHVVVTVYVNPLQYEDPAVYPSTPEADCALCEAEGARVVYLPQTGEVYREGDPLVRVAPGPGGEGLEAEGRPGYFDGVLTVMLKMTNLVRPDAVFLGEKDFQQLALFRRMVFDLDVPAEVVAVPTVRERDGLALSSRNTRLSPAERTTALALPRALAAGVQAASNGSRGEDVLAAARKVLAEAAHGEIPVQPLYVELTGPGLEPSPQTGQAWLLAAVQVGATRLIDGMPLTLTPPLRAGRG
ncbi:4-phosphopantoate--beta-alanine ligase [Streptomyces sp. NPDC012794]|uniref:4-phosphopantoate--beta-alanine ligase n=1 Tax=Streptomyces sp. NPDC012794 TaxID=3364850 RepID=UPI0036C6CAF7